MIKTLRTIILIVGLFILGFLSNDVYRYYNYEREYNGLWIPNIQNYSEARDIAYSYDKFGDWVCINTRNMNYEELVKTCEHESGHEIFAEMCEKNQTKCLEAIK